MQAIKRKNPLTESFLVQLDVDLESAGLEDSRTLRSQKLDPGLANRSEGCPMQHLRMPPFVSEGIAPTYGDQGLSRYNNPNQASQMVPPTAASTFGFTSTDTPGHSSGSDRFELPNRQRTPGSFQGSATHRSPQSATNVEMDTSPDNSGDNRTPSSTTVSHQNASSHTSHTGYSPQSQQPLDQGTLSPTHQDLAHLAGIFDPNNSTFSTDFDMHTFPASAPENQQPGFVVPQNWGAGSTGLTPGPTGMTPGRDMGDLMGMTDADWNQVMEEFPTWDTGMIHDGNVSEAWNGRRS